MKKITEQNKYKLNENAIHTVKVLEAMEGLNFEPVKIQKIVERIEIPTGGSKEISKPTYDKVMRVLETLELVGWVEQNEKKEWILGAKILRLSNRYSEMIAAALNK